MHCEIGQVVATRSLAGILFDSSAVNITVNFGLPFERKHGVHVDWWCPYQILGLGDDRVEAIGGTDSVQALYLAMAFVGSKLGNYLQADQSGWAEVNFGLPPLPEIPEGLMDGPTSSTAQ